MRLVFTELKTAGGRARPKDVLASVETQAALSSYEKSPTNTGAVRWETHVRFYTTDCVKAGYLTKSGGYWLLTPQGEAALQLPQGQLIRSAQRLYRAWKKRQSQVDTEPADEQAVETEQAERQTVYEKAVEDARAEIDEHIDNLGPYDFQKVVAELLVGMGYFVPFVAPPGADGGIDILAYTDPLGTQTPRIKVQVRHREQKVSAKDVRELEGLLRREGDIGLLVSSGGFTSDALREIRSSVKHIETMDLDRLISLWQEHYEKIREPGKMLLPLVKVFFLSPPEE
jgi:restriction system protein